MAPDWCRASGVIVFMLHFLVIRGAQMATRKPTDIVQLKLRLPEWLRRNIERNARKSGRSLNGELVHQLQKAYTQTENDLQKVAEAAAQKAADDVFERFAQVADERWAQWVKEGMPLSWAELDELDPAQRAIVEEEMRKAAEKDGSALNAEEREPPNTEKEEFPSPKQEQPK
jgi:hypothetical protein